jgi:hypothetical protein
MTLRLTFGVLGLSCVCLWGASISSEDLTIVVAQTSASESLPTAVLQRQQYQTQGVLFETPPGFSALQPLGGQTVGVTFPAAAAGARQVTVRLMEIQPDQLGLSSLSPREFSEYVRYRFFGLTSTPQSSQTRRFLGQAVTGEVLMQPQRGSVSYLELYLIPLSRQRQLAIAFEADAELPVAILEQTIQTVAESLREDPKAKRRRKRE